MKRPLPGPTKSFTGGTAGSVIWTESEIPYGGAALKGFFFVLTGTAFDVDSLTRVRVFADSKEIWRVDELQLAQWYSTIGKRALMAAAETRFEILFDFANLGCAAPEGKPLRVQVDYDNTSSGACTIQINYILGDAESNCWMQLLASGMNIGASQSTPVSVPISAEGFLRGIILPDAADITSAKIFVGSTLMADLVSGQAILAVQDYYSGVDTDSGAKLYIFDAPIQIVPGTRIELTTGAGFGGATEELTLWTENPQGT